MVVVPESAGAAGAVVVESAGPGEVDCCLEQATRARLLMHSKRRLRFIGHLTVCLECRRGSFTVPGGTQRTVASGVPLRWGPGRQATPQANGELFLGGSALLLLGRVLRAGLAKRALINLAATAPAISLTHGKTLQIDVIEGREVYRASGPSAKRAAS